MIQQTTTRVQSLIVAAIITLGAAPQALAQTHPARTARNPKTPSSQGTAGRSQLPSTSGSVTLPAWLDDAETLDPGTASVELSVGRWSSVDGGETDGPVLDFSVGLTDRIQVGATLPYYRASYTDGYSAQGLGDTYLSAKIQLFDPSDYPVGISVQPLVEILSDASLSDDTLGLSRVNWGLPITFEVGSEETRTRAYVTTGYFSRNALFVGGAVERDVFSSVTLLGMVSYSYATKTAASSDLAGLSRSRTDATGMIYVSVSPTVTIFGGAGRTISQLDQNGARLIASAGVRIETAKPQVSR